MKQLERARFAFMKAQSLPGGDQSAAVFTNLGLVKMKMGKEFEAREHFEEALRVDSGAPSAKVNLGHLMLQNLDYEGARSLLEEATRALPGNIPVKLNLAVALRGTGEVDRAQTLYEEIAADPDSEYRADAILNLAILQGDVLRDYDSAIKSYEEYIAARASVGDEVAEDDVVYKYVKEMRKLKRRQDKKREREARKAAEKAAETGQGEAP
jgi:Tfp pilus assembly protein PilF